MEMDKQIKKYRSELHLSQDELAEKIFVTRQSISNWENAKTYPDLNSLVLLSSLFDISLDILVKGDLNNMKAHIETEDIKALNHDSVIFTMLMITTIVSVVPLFVYYKLIGVGIWFIIASFMMYYALRIEKKKKVHDIQTYKEIVAFIEGKRLDEIEKYREKAIRPYQALLSIIASGLITLLVGSLMFLWLN